MMAEDGYEDYYGKDEVKEGEIKQAIAQAAIEVKAPLLTRGDALRFAANFLAKQDFFASWIPISRLQQGALEEDGNIGKLTGHVLADAHFTITWAECRDPVCPRCLGTCRGMHYWDISVVPEPGMIHWIDITLKDLLVILQNKLETQDAIIDRMRGNKELTDFMGRDDLLREIHEKDLLIESLLKQLRKDLDDANDFSDL